MKLTTRAGVVVGLLMSGAAAALLLPGRGVRARPVAFPMLGEMWKKADLVAVIQPLSTRRTSDKLDYAGPKYGARDPKNYQGLETTFKVVEVLRRSGAAARFEGTSLTVLHFAYKAGPIEFNGGLFVYFHLPPTEYVTVPVKKDQMKGAPLMPWAGRDRPTYLAFLCKRDDGRFQPVTGNYDAAPSFRTLTVPAGSHIFYATEGIPGGKEKRRPSVETDAAPRR
jgi:hypothetical protein